MNVAFISGDIVGARISGPRQSLCSLASALEDFGVNARVYTTRSSEPLDHDGFAIHPVANLCCADYDVVVVNGIFHTALIRYIRISQNARVPVVIAPRGSFMRSSMTMKKRAFLGAFWPIISNTSSHFLSCGEAHNSINPGARVILSPNGVNRRLSSRTAARPQLGSDITFGFMGRLDLRHKGLDLLLGAASRLAKEGLPVRFLLCGPTYAEFLRLHARWSYRSEFPNLVQLLPATGSIEDKKMFFSRIHYFVHPSRYEGLPQSCLEAMACAVPVVISTACNLGEFLPRYHPALIHPPTEDGAYAAYRSVFSINQQSYNMLSDQVYHVAQECFDWTTIARGFAHSLAQLLHQAPTADTPPAC